MPKPPISPIESESVPPSRQVSKADKELLIKGVLCALIGACILLAPYVARSPAVLELMAGAVTVGWFALVLGCAFIALFVRRQFAAARSRR